VAARVQVAVLSDNDGDPVALMIHREIIAVQSEENQRERSGNEVVLSNILNQQQGRRLAIEADPYFRNRVGSIDLPPPPPKKCCDDVCDSCSCCCVLKYALYVFLGLLCLPCLPLILICYCCCKDD